MPPADKTAGLAPETRAQIEALDLQSDHPLIISDADEVLVAFIEALEIFLERRDLYIDLTTFALHGNIRRRDDDERVPNDDVSQLLKDMFVEMTAHMPEVPGASAGLRDLSSRAQVVILTNVPRGQHEDRISGLAKHGINYPVVSNAGPKGPAVRALADITRGPVLFIDDIPTHHSSVAEHANGVHRVHFVADKRLQGLLPASKDAHHRPDDWEQMTAYIHDWLDALG